MTTTATIPAPGSPETPTARPAGTGRVGFGRVLRSESIKFTSLRSTVVLIGCTLVVMVGFAALGAWGIGSMLEAMGDEAAAAMGPGADITEVTNTLSGSGITFAQLIIGSLAVLLISSEFTTGSARATFTAVPQRHLVFWSKALLVAVVSYVVTAVSMLIAFLVITPIAEHYGLELAFGAEAHQRMIWIGSLYVAVVALIGFSLGALLRSSAGAIVSLAGLIFVLPMAFSMIPADFFQDAVRFLPPDVSNLLILGEGYSENALELWQGWLLLGLWGAVPLALAAVVTQHRDI
jgi:ABC-2 type transport system permease protein